MRSLCDAFEIAGRPAEGLSPHLTPAVARHAGSQHQKSHQTGPVPGHLRHGGARVSTQAKGCHQGVGIRAAGAEQGSSPF